MDDFPLDVPGFSKALKRAEDDGDAQRAQELWKLAERTLPKRQYDELVKWEARRHQHERWKEGL